MPYETQSSYAPGYSGAFASSLYQVIHNNPNDSDSTNYLWPTKYSSYVQKRNADLGSFIVNDEIRSLTEIDTLDSNSLYLYHKIVPPGTIAGFSGTILVSDGVLVTGLTDYHEGKIHFATLPTGNQFTVVYIAQPDAIAAEHINVMQNSLMKIEQVLGATDTPTYGIKNAKFLLIGSDLTGSQASYMPNAVPSDGFTESSIIFRGESGYQHSVQIGNSYDILKFNSSRIEFLSTEGYAASAPWPAPGTGNLQIMMSGDTHLRGQATVGASWPARSVGIYTNSGQYTGAAIRILGDVFVAGSLFVTGSQTTLVSQTTITGHLVQSNLTVSGDANIIANLRVGGTFSVTGSSSLGYATVRNDLYVNGHIGLSNSGAPSLVDGLDPSYVADTMAFWNRDPNTNSVISCYWSPIRYTEWFDPAGGTTFTGSRTITMSGQVLSKTGSSSGNYIQTTMKLPYAPLGIYEDSIWDGESMCRWISGPVNGRESLVLKMSSLNSSSGYSTGSMIRLVNDSQYTNVSAGDRFEIYAPGNRYCSPSFIDTPTKVAGDPVITISATNANPLVFNVNGQIRRMSQSSVEVNMAQMLNNTSSYPANGSVTGYIYTRSIGNLQQSEYSQSFGFYARPYYAPLQEEICLGHVNLTRTGGTWGNDANWSIQHYAPDAYWDSGWTLTFFGLASRPSTHGATWNTSISNWGNGHSGAGPESFQFSATYTNSKHITLNHNIGDIRKVLPSEVDIYIATTYWNDTADILVDAKNEIESNTLRKHMYKVTDFSILKQDRNKLLIAFNLPIELNSMWAASSWTDYKAPSAGNGTRAYVRFIVRPKKQTNLR